MSRRCLHKGTLRTCSSYSTLYIYICIIYCGSVGRGYPSLPLLIKPLWTSQSLQCKGISPHWDLNGTPGYWMEIITLFLKTGVSTPYIATSKHLEHAKSATTTKLNMQRETRQYVWFHFGWDTLFGVHFASSYSADPAAFVAGVLSQSQSRLCCMKPLDCDRLGANHHWGQQLPQSRLESAGHPCQTSRTWAPWATVQKVPQLFAEGYT